jgi:hypothetical protein
MKDDYNLKIFPEVGFADVCQHFTDGSDSPAEVSTITTTNELYD